MGVKKDLNARINQNSVEKNILYIRSVIIYESKKYNYITLRDFNRTIYL